VLTRNTQGVRLMRLDDADLLVGMAAVEHLSGDPDGTEGEAEGQAEGEGGLEPPAAADDAAPAADAAATDGATPPDLP